MSLRKLLGTVLAAGFTAASFDLLAASLMSNQTPYAIMKVVSIGWYGREHPKGLTEALVGCASHYGILLVAAALYAAAGLRWPLLWKRPVLCGFAYGTGIFLFMRVVVLPLSRVGWTHFKPILLVDYASNAVLCGVTIGLIVSLGLKAVRQPA